MPASVWRIEGTSGGQCQGREQEGECRARSRNLLTCRCIEVLARIVNAIWASGCNGNLALTIKRAPDDLNARGASSSSSDTRRVENYAAQHGSNETNFVKRSTIAARPSVEGQICPRYRGLGLLRVVTDRCQAGYETQG